MTVEHSPGFVSLVEDARSRIREVQAPDMPAELKRVPNLRLIDVREESEFVAGHLRGAEWISKGLIEYAIEVKHPDKSEPLYLYCGGGYRSALAADNLRKMGYTNVVSIDGGWRALQDILPIE